MTDALLAPPATTARPPLRHLLHAAQFDRPLVEDILKDAAALEGMVAGAAPLAGRILAALFYEPSTRTRLSFEAAMLRLGGQVIGAQDAARALSAAKGESLEDTIRVIGGYADVVVLRHPEAGAAERAARVCGVPVINAGDGTGQHPTQALLDLFTINRELGRLDNLRIGLAGDLRHGRTAHSLALLLACFEGIELTLISPPALRMDGHLVQELISRGVAVREEHDLLGVASGLDVLYQTRLQRERLGADAPGSERGWTMVDRSVMDALPGHAILMHPLPRVDAIDPAVDADPRAAYFRQARHGVAVRMAILHRLVARR